MGHGQAKLTSNLVIHVKTGNRSGAGTDSDVKIVLHGEDGSKSPEIKLNRFLTNDHERGRTDSFNTPELCNLWPIKKIEVWRNDFGFKSDWFVEKFWIENKHTSDNLIFPVLRWIAPNKHYVFSLYDLNLPQFDENVEQRKEELESKRRDYCYVTKESGLPVQIKDLPKDEEFSFDYKWELVSNKMKYILNTKLINVMSRHWMSLDDLRNVYKMDLGEPNGVNTWSNDLWFGAQRIQGCNPVLLKLCTEIPEKFGCDPECIEPFFSGKTLRQMMDDKKLFIVDLEILENLNIPEKTICAPIALFFLDPNNRIRPVAIQLFQKKGPYNPVFYPSDPPYTWLLVKMWYNNADASYHQSLTHLGLTHLVMESATICTHRNLSPSHPLFKLLVPHFLYLLAINSRGIEKLVSPNGWVDKTMSIRRSGMLEIIRRGFKKWRLDVDGTLPNEIKSRGLSDPEILPHYPYRDDGLLLYDAIKIYVSRIVEHHYDNPQKIKDDYELQSFAEELSKDAEQGGVGFQGVPGGGIFSTAEEIIQTLTSIIFICSVGHAAANFMQYDEYAFPPNYPSLMRGDVPKKDQNYTEQDIIKQLPSKELTLSVMVVTKLLSEKGTQSLGDFEVQYMYDDVGVEAVKEFREKLKEISDVLDSRNKIRSMPYRLLDPKTIPNAISI